jgi:hypothetical protein
VVPTGENLGDLVIRTGVELVMRAVLPEAEEGSLAIDTSQEPLQEDDYTHIVVAGTPWLWDQCTQSRKYQQLVRLCALHPRTIKIALGLGACFPLNAGASLILDNPRTVLELRTLYKRFSCITVRDEESKTIFDAIGVTSVLLPCPSLLPAEPGRDRHTQDSLGPVLFFHDPSTGISSEVLDRDFCERYLATERRIVECFQARVFAVMRPDYQTARNLGLDAELLTSPDMILDTVSRASIVFSGRVHAAAPAAGMGKPTFILPTDTRYLTAGLVGARPIWTPEQVVPELVDIAPEPVDRGALKSRYIDVVRAALTR